MGINESLITPQVVKGWTTRAKKLFGDRARLSFELDWGCAWYPGETPDIAVYAQEITDTQLAVEKQNREWSKQHG